MTILLRHRARAIAASTSLWMLYTAETSFAILLRKTGSWNVLVEPTQNGGNTLPIVGAMRKDLRMQKSGSNRTMFRNQRTTTVARPKQVRRTGHASHKLPSPTNSEIRPSRRAFRGQTRVLLTMVSTTMSRYRQGLQRQTLQMMANAHACRNLMNTVSEGKSLSAHSVVGLSGSIASDLGSKCAIPRLYLLLSLTQRVRKHVHADLRAYVCTHPSCSMMLFETKRSWADHEHQKHRLTWSCVECVERFPSRTDLAVHYRENHRADISSTSLGLLLDVCSSPSDVVLASECKLCHWESKIRRFEPDTPSDLPILVSAQQFFGHVAGHLEDVARFALPRILLETGTDHISGSAISNEHIYSSCKVSLGLMPSPRRC